MACTCSAPSSLVSRRIVRRPLRRRLHSRSAGNWYKSDKERYDYDYSDPYYYYTPTYTPLYDPFYDPYCDYYTPPWGYPLDYCRYQTWNQPVYYGGLWYSGPIYYRAIGGVNWF